jgi:hypothetical protein
MVEAGSIARELLLTEAVTSEIQSLRAASDFLNTGKTLLIGE